MGVEMSKKKFNPEELEEIVGPMNEVAKADAIVYTGVADPEHMNEYERRTILIKKQKIKLATKKSERRLSKQIIQHIDEIDPDDK
jgi:hypothetical protein